MSHIRVLICQVEDEAQPEKMRELHRFDLGRIDHKKLKPETALDQIETRALNCAQSITRRLLEYEWENVDEMLVEDYEKSFPPGRGDP